MITDAPEFETGLLGLIACDPEFFEPFAPHFYETQFRGESHQKAIRAVKKLFEDKSNGFPEPDEIADAVKRVLTTGDSYASEIVNVLTTPPTPQMAQRIRSEFKDWFRVTLVGAMLDYQAPGMGEIQLVSQVARLKESDPEGRDTAVQRQVRDLEKTLKDLEDVRLNMALEVAGVLEELRTAGSLDSEAVVWATPSRALERPTPPKPTYPPWCDWLSERDVRIPSTSSIALLGNTGDGKSIIQTWIMKGYIERGVPVIDVDYENDIDDKWIDMAVCICQEQTPRDLDLKMAKEIVRGFCEEKCGSPDAYAIISFEDALADDEDIMRVVKKIEKKTKIRYRVLSVDALGDMVSEKLEKELKSEWSASKRMIIRLKRACKKSGRVLHGTIQTNKAGEKDKRDGKVGGIDTQGGSVAFAKKSTVYMVITQYGLKILKCRMAGHLKDQTIPTEYVRMKVGHNQRGFVRMKKTQDELESDARWVVVVEGIKSSLVRSAPLSFISGGDKNPLEIDYTVRPGLGRVQAADLQAWLLIVGDALKKANPAVNRTALLTDLTRRGIIESKDEDRRPDGKGSRTYYYLRCSS